MSVFYLKNISQAFNLPFAEALPTCGMIGDVKWIMDWRDIPCQLNFLTYLLIQATGT
jgi:hypothetical protein